jgi:hypothetical protein
MFDTMNPEHLSFLLGYSDCALPHIPHPFVEIMVTPILSFWMSRNADVKWYASILTEPNSKNWQTVLSYTCFAATWQMAHDPGLVTPIRDCLLDGDRWVGRCQCNMAVLHYVFTACKGRCERNDQRASFRESWGYERPWIRCVGVHWGARGVGHCIAS